MVDHLLHAYIISVFILAQKPLKVMLAYEKALQWQELFELALREGVSSDEIIAMAYRVSGSNDTVVISYG